ncbi:hypothetical protein A1O3_05825 [Capronia epimyces CBS 606.96]|uniref:Oxidoreductase n=1 Tax=Capronia epimyces CBS 606.96 TaxID=1182542 RepID=W9Y682_9EURO|nr:uncharacterized protein A1O3_05825 [Capronia epimyces CBS 606.96]EXJ85150.1 hypothetical protein A1O3_05825 [Capronia epimyces CBS 606.96]
MATSTFGFDTTGREVAKAFAGNVGGRTFLITGPSAGGVGAVTATSLAVSQPAQLILAGRTRSKIEPVLQEINAINPDIRVDFVHLDLGDQASIRSAVDAINRIAPKIDVLINNAGIMALKEYRTTPEGIEAQFGTNHIGHFLLTKLLLPKIIAAGKGARIVNVSSNGYLLSGVRFDDHNFNGGNSYNPWLAYAQSKTANILFTFGLAERLKDRGILSFAVTPGLVLETKLQADVSQELFAKGIETYKEVYAGREMPPLEKPKPLAASASTTLVAALDPSLEGKSGAYLQNCQTTDVEPHGTGGENADRLWALSERLVGENFEC